jgi:phospholipid-translocating ATPase
LLEGGVGNAARRATECASHAVLALALCHNVTPVLDDGQWSLQAASPDEVTLVTFAADAGLRLAHRDDHQIKLQDRTGAEYAFDILHTFPFSSETKRMGIIVSVVATGKKFFILKGADIVMKERITRKGASWLDEEVETYAREGLRTLVVAWKAIGDAEYREWAAQYERAGSAMIGRDQKVRAVIDKLETRLELLALTGVEDKLQVDVQETLETMRACGVKVWMLTGDKLETAICIAISTSLKNRSQQFEILDSREVRHEC